jgi:hypothetical protein
MIPRCFRHHFLLFFHLKVHEAPFEACISHGATPGHFFAIFRYAKIDKEMHICYLLHHSYSDNSFDLYKPISYRLRTPKRSALFLPTSKNRFSHHTWKMPSPIKTPIWKMLHHLTRPFVLSAVFRCILSRTTIYDCSSLTWARSSESWRTGGV